MLSFSLKGETTTFSQDSLTASKLYRTAIDYGRSNEPEMALDFFNQTLKYRKRMYGEKNYRLGGIYMNMAIQYKNLHRLEDAYACYVKAEEMYLFNLPSNDSRMGDLYSNLGNYFKTKGNQSEAIRFQEMAVHYYENATDQYNPNNYFSAIYNLANAYHLAGREEMAIATINKHIKKVPPFFQNQYKNLLASIYAVQGKYTQANESYLALIDRLSVDPSYTDTDIADQMTAYAQFLIIASLPDTALYWLDKAERIYASHPSRKAELGEIYRAYARVHQDKGVESAVIDRFQAEKTKLLTKALAYYEKAFSCLNDISIREEFDKETIKNSNYPVATLYILQEAGDVYFQLASLSKDDIMREKLNHLENALKCYDTGAQYVEHLRTGFVSEESKIQFTSIQQNIFKQAVRAAYELFRQTGESKYIEMAFINSERNKAASLFDHITENRAREISHLPDSLIRLEQILTTRLVYYKEKLHEVSVELPDSIQKINELKNRVYETEQQWNGLRYEFEKNYREYFDLKYNEKTATIRDIQQMLRRDEVLVSYTLNDQDNDLPGELYVITLSKNEASFNRQPFDSEDRENVNNVFTIISDPDFLNITLEEFQAYARSAQALFDILIAPISTFVVDKKMTVIPDGMLSYLPFEALLTEKAPDQSVHFHDLPYFIFKNTVNYAYSAQLFRFHSNNKGAKGKGILAVAPSYPGYYLVEQDTVRLPQLNGTKEEVNFLASSFKTTPLLNESATEKRVRELAQDYDILHLATHTLINDSLPMFSRLAFYPDASDSLDNDGWLNTSDIYNMRLRARMAVLSACRTGSGTLRRGEGLMSLARGFFYAGCPAVVLTLWEVDDKAGTTIMNEFYHNLKYGKAKDAALRNAKLKYLAQADPITSHPHLWLGYVTVGEPDPLFNGNQDVLVYLMIFFLFWIILSIIFRKKAVAAWSKPGTTLNALKNYSFSLFKRESTR